MRIRFFLIGLVVVAVLAACTTNDQTTSLVMEEGFVPYYTDLAEARSKAPPRAMTPPSAPTASNPAVRARPEGFQFVEVMARPFFNVLAGARQRANSSCGPYHIGHYVARKSNDS